MSDDIHLEAVASTSHSPPEEHNDDNKTRFRQGIRQFFLRVTVAGFDGIYRATSVAERVFWTLVYAVVFALTFYFVKLVIQKQLTEADVRYEYDIRQTDQLQLPNVTVCIPIYINSSLLEERFAITDEILERARRLNLTADTVFRLMATNFAPNLRVNELDKKLQRLMNRVYGDSINEQSADDSSGILVAAQPACWQVLANCQFDGDPFDCCENALFVVDDFRTCYKVPTSRAERNFVQQRPGQQYGLTFDLLLAEPMSPDDVINEGVNIFLNDVPSFVASPLTSWTRSHLHVRLQAKLRQSFQDCYVTPPIAGVFGLYDSEGWRCRFAQLLDKYMFFIECRFSLFDYLPNSSVACDNNAVTVFKTLLYSGFSVYTGDLLGRDMVDRIMKKGGVRNERNIVDTLRYAPVCKPLCTRWEYVSFASYLDMTSDNDDNPDLRFTRVSIYFGDFIYQVVNEVKDTKTYTRFSQIGATLGVYCGSSCITIIQFVVYLASCLYYYPYEASLYRPEVIVRHRTTVRTF